MPQVNSMWMQEHSMHANVQSGMQELTVSLPLRSLAVRPTASLAIRRAAQSPLALRLRSPGAPLIAGGALRRR